jgi:ACR3 family arsenite efflux pump ArsB
LLLQLYRFPQTHLLVAVPAVFLVAFGVGLVTDTSALAGAILPVTVVMIFATMVGLPLRELVELRSVKRLLVVAIVLNFVWIPLLATGIGVSLLAEHPTLFAGLALIALLPTSGMTIAWTGLQHANVAAAVKLTASGLLLGAIATPWYLMAMVGEYIPIELGAILRTISVVVLVPLVLSQIATRIILARTTRRHLQTRIKPMLAPLSVWGLLYLVFVTTSSRAGMIVEDLGLLLLAVAAVVGFYSVNFLVSTLVAVRWFPRDDGVALVNSTVLRNLSIAIGIAATQFSGEAALLITVAFMLQNQSIAYYARAAEQRWFRPDAQQPTSAGPAREASGAGG